MAMYNLGEQREYEVLSKIVIQFSPIEYSGKVLKNVMTSLLDVYPVENRSVKPMKIEVKNTILQMLPALENLFDRRFFKIAIYSLVLFRRISHLYGFEDNIIVSRFTDNERVFFHAWFISFIVKDWCDDDIKTVASYIRSLDRFHRILSMGFGDYWKKYSNRGTSRFHFNLNRN